MNEDAVATASPDPRPNQWYLDQIASDVNLIAAALAGADAATLATPVAACPGWSVQHLVEHLSGVHRWATYAVTNEAAPPDHVKAQVPDLTETDGAAPGDVLAAWLQAGATELLATLANLDPKAPTWHPWPGDKVGAFWPRRQMQETSIHRWDVQTALATADPISVEVAADGIDEWFALAVPRRHERDGIAYPTGSFHVHCTDTGDANLGGEWLGWTDERGEYHMVRAHQKGDAALRGPAGAINLTLWGRPPSNANELTTAGDEAVIAAWTNFGG